MTFDEAVEAAGPNGVIYRYFLGRRFHTGSKIKTEWNADCDYIDYCGYCKEEHLYITQDATDRNDFQDSVMARAVCVTEARQHNDWEVWAENTPDLEDWNPPTHMRKTDYYPHDDSWEREALSALQKAKPSKPAQAPAGPTCTDWRLYEMLTKEDWRPGDEPPIQNKVTISYYGKTIVLPLPPGAEISR